MAKMCNKCFELYQSNFKQMIIPSGEHHLEEIDLCPKLSCHTGTIVDIDDNMVYVIKELNRKGYPTRYCCGGHVGEGTTGAYIMFETPVYKLPSRPEGFEQDNEFGSITLRRILEEEYYKDGDMALEILRMAAQLITWVDSLPIMVIDDGSDRPI